LAKAGANEILSNIDELILLSIMSKTAHMTTNMSNLFHPFLKYVSPKAISFNIASIIKIALKK
jgi:hypothetical protein